MRMRMDDEDSEDDEDDDRAISKIGAH